MTNPVLAGFVLSLGLATAAAGSIEQSKRPLDRPVQTEVTQSTAVMVATSGAIRPVLRPFGTTQIIALPHLDDRPIARPPSEQDIALASLDTGYAGVKLDQSIRPYLRPKGLVELVMSKKHQKKKGSVCGDIDIQGEEVGDVPGRIRQCGIKDAVRVTSVAGVTLSTGALMNCKTAKALKTWTENSVKPAFRKRGPIESMTVAAHYVCRTRNHQPGGKISEHGKGNAIDISAFTLRGGEVITVSKGWSHGYSRDLLRRVHRGACGPFGTVLGPNSDRFHKDHFHMDTASYRSGPYCR